MLVAQVCLILCNPLDCNPPGSSVCGILQTRILEWVAIPFSGGSYQPSDQTCVSCIAGRFLTDWDLETFINSLVLSLLLLLTDGHRKVEADFYLMLGGISLRSSGFLCLDSDNSGHDFPWIYSMKNQEAFTQKRDFLFGFSSKNTFARYLTQRCFCWLHLWIYAWFSELDRKKCSMKALYLEKMQFVDIILSEHYHWRIKESRSESSTLAALAVWVSVPGESWYPEEAEPGSRIAVSQWDC